MKGLAPLGSCKCMHYANCSNKWSNLGFVEEIRDIFKDFPRPDLGLYNSPFPNKNEQNLHKRVSIIPNFLVLHFGENFMKIR